MEQVQNQEQPQKHVQSVVEKVRLYTASSHCSVWYRMYRLVRIVIEEERLFVKNVRIVPVQDIFPVRRRFLSRFRQELMTDRV